MKAMPLEAISGLIVFKLSVISNISMVDAQTFDVRNAKAAGRM
jgi:hypothetical protein